MHSSDPVVLIGAAAVSETCVSVAQSYGEIVVAADGGAANCLRFGIIPRAVIGDFDSFPEQDRADFAPETLHRIAEQDSTDFDKALRNIAAPLILGLGFMGGRVDHALAAFHVLTAHPDRRCILISEQDVVFLAPPHLMLDLEAGTRVSLFPMGEVTGQSIGLTWPIDGLTFSPASRVGTSNRAEGPVDITIHAPLMLTILPLRCLDKVVTALREAPGWAGV